MQLIYGGSKQISNCLGTAVWEEKRLDWTSPVAEW